MKHTQGELNAYGMRILDDKGNLIASTQYGSENEYEKAKANAARIARCWNSHDKLLKALQVAADSFRNAASVTGNKAYDEVAFEFDKIVYDIKNS